MKSRLLAVAVLLSTVSAQGADYTLALPGYHYQFPRDHFDHPDYLTEWWYYTGNLKAADGHRFGFELTFFRQAIARDADQSNWHIHDLYMAHLALSDLDGRRFYHDERLNRSGPGIAGVDQGAGTIWNGNWQVQLTEARQTLRGLSRNFELQLNLVPAKPPVIHGRDGISQKAAGAGHASHYISFSRLLTSGSIQLIGSRYAVEGTSWMDHEFFSEPVDTNERGWDWLSLQLDDNTELMLYRLRHKDGSADPYSSGTYIDAQGHCLFLAATDFTLTPIGKTWTSDRTRGTYPIQWHIAIPKLRLEMDIGTPLASQELPGGIGPAYWEGAIDIAGRAGDSPLRASGPVRGVGYLEMTGYGNGAHPR